MQWKKQLLANKLGNLIGVLNYDLENTKQNNTSPHCLILETDMQHNTKANLWIKKRKYGLAVQAPEKNTGARQENTMLILLHIWWNRYIGWRHL